jgi:hypothetical protein
MKALFDMAEGRILLFDGKTKRLIDKIPFGVSEDFKITIGEGRSLPDDIDDAAVSLPIGALDFRVLDLELADRDKIREVLPFELQGLMLEDPESVVADALLLRQPEQAEGGRKVLAVYADRAYLRGLLSGLKDLDVDPSALTSLDMGYALERSPSPEELVRMLMGEVRAEGEERELRASAEIESPTLNLRRGEFAYKKESERLRRSIIIAAALSALILVVFSADMALRIISAKKESALTKGAILGLYADIFPEEKPQGVEGLAYKLRSHLKDLKEREARATGLSPLEFLLALQGRITPGVTVGDITLERETISLKGEASTLGALQDFKAKLDGFLPEVKISETGQSVKGKTGFTITAATIKRGEEEKQ